MTNTKVQALNWIGGEWVGSPTRLDGINPATGEVIGTYAEAGEADALRAIDIAYKAFRDGAWRNDRRLQPSGASWTAARA